MQLARRYRFAALVMCLILSLPMAGCGGNRQETDKVRTLLQSMYTCPDETYRKAYDEQMKQPVPAAGDNGGVVAVTEANSPLLQWVADRYKSLFTAAAYESFLSRNTGDRYQQASVGEGWNSRIARLDITYDGGGKYTFDAAISVTDAQSNSVDKQVRGTVEFDDAGSIKWFSETTGLTP